MLTLREIKQLDTIEINMEQLDIATELYNKHSNKTFDFFLNEGVIKTEDDVMNGIRYIYFKINEKKQSVVISFYFYSRDSYNLGYIFSSEIDFKKTLETKRVQYKVLYIKKADTNKESMKVVVLMFLAVFEYLTYLIDNRETKIKEVKLTVKKNKKTINTTNKLQKRTINIADDKIQYKIITDNKDVIEKLIKREYTRHTDSWTVRGHTRKYKSGKIVYIKPYVKGKGEKEPKTYKV